MSDTFNVVVFFKDGSHHTELEGVEGKAAVEKARSITRSVGSVIGVVDRVIITDNGDLTVFEWVNGKGVTFGFPGQDQPR